MFTQSSIETKLDAEINSLLDKLKETTKDSEDYATLVDRMAKLHKLKIEETGVSIDNTVKVKEMENREKRFKPVSLDTALVVTANVFGIIWLTRYEKTNVIKSRSALGLVMKPRGNA